MAPLPVIANTFRCALIGRTYQGVKSVNVFHVEAATADVTDIADALRDAAENRELMSGKPGSSTPNRLDITPLDGTSGLQSFTVQEDQFTSTSATTAETVPEAAAVVQFHTALRGPAHRGRMFIGPLAEASIANGFLVGDTQGDLAAAWNDYWQVLLGLTPTIGLVVASYELEEATNLSSITVAPGVATQRRRLLQTR